MRVRLFTIYASAVAIWHATAQDSGPQTKLSPACIEFNQKIVGNVKSGQLADAESAFSGAEIHKESGSEQACIWLTMHNRGYILALSGRREEAEVLSQQALRILDKLYSPDDPIRFGSLHLLWSVQYQQGKLGQARQTFQNMRTLRLDRSRDRAIFYGAAADQLQTEGRYKEAEPEFLRALAAWKEEGRGESAEAAALLTSLGTLQVAQGRYLDAGKTLNRAFVIVNSAKDAIPMDLVNLYGARATLHARQKRWQAAEEDLKSAISLADRDTRLDPAELKRLLVNYVYVLRKTHRKKEARSVEARAAAIHAPALRNAIVDVTELVRKER